MGGISFPKGRSCKYGHAIIPMAALLGTMISFVPTSSEGQVNTIRPPDSVKMPPVQNLPRQEQNPEMPALMPQSPSARPDSATMSPAGGMSYDPSGRRDPFIPMIENNQQGQSDTVLPPLQRVGLTEVSLIGIVWGAYGYTAMVQTPDGKGYSLRRGTRVGPNNGVVSSITERGIIVQERFTDVYGNKQEREYVKLLHAKEGIE